MNQNSASLVNEAAAIEFIGVDKRFAARGK
jgi:hypothetical protein